MGAGTLVILAYSLEPAGWDFTGNPRAAASFLREDLSPSVPVSARSAVQPGAGLLREGRRIELAERAVKRHGLGICRVRVKTANDDEHPLDEERSRAREQFIIACQLPGSERKSA